MFTPKKPKIFENFSSNRKHEAEENVVKKKGERNFFKYTANSMSTSPIHLYVLYTGEKAFLLYFSSFFWGENMFSQCVFFFLSFTTNISSAENKYFPITFAALLKPKNETEKTYSKFLI